MLHRNLREALTVCTPPPGTGTAGTGTGTGIDAELVRRQDPGCHGEGIELPTSLPASDAEKIIINVY